jgi:hypothetical protein
MRSNPYYYYYYYYYCPCAENMFFDTHTHTIWQSKLCWLLLWFKNVIKSKEICWYILTNFLGIHNAPRNSLSLSLSLSVALKSEPSRVIICHGKFHDTIWVWPRGCRDMGLVGSLSLEVKSESINFHGNLMECGLSILGCCWDVSKQNSRVIP